MFTLHPYRANFKTFLPEIHKEFERLLDGVSPTWTSNSEIWPTLDLWEVDDAFILEVDLPGLTKDDVEIQIHDGLLQITGERQETTEANEESYHYSERKFGTFKRTVKLPKSIRSTKVNASFENGVLAITLPKSEESKPRKIKVS